MEKQCEENRQLIKVEGTLSSDFGNNEINTISESHKFNLQTLNGQPSDSRGKKFEEEPENYIYKQNNKLSVKQHYKEDIPMPIFKTNLPDDGECHFVNLRNPVKIDEFNNKLISEIKARNDKDVYITKVADNIEDANTYNIKTPTFFNSKKQNDCIKSVGMQSLDTINLSQNNINNNLLSNSKFLNSKIDVLNLNKTHEHKSQCKFESEISDIKVTVLSRQQIKNIKMYMKKLALTEYDDNGGGYSHHLGLGINNPKLIEIWKPFANKNVKTIIPILKKAGFIVFKHGGHSCISLPKYKIAPDNKKTYETRTWKDNADKNISQDKKGK